MSARNHNSLVFILFGCAWLALMLVRYLWVGSRPVSDVVAFSWIPTIIAVLVTLLMSGDWLNKLSWAAGVPVIPTLIFILVASNSPDPEAFAFFLFFGLGALLAYWIVVMIVSFIAKFQSKKAPNKSFNPDGTNSAPPG